MLKKKIGILGGTFDPIHLGHIATADFILRAVNLDKVIFVPANTPPHKTETGATAKDRYIMTELATCNNPNFFVSDIEIKRSGLSYTVDTVRELKDFYGSEVELYFIVGSDVIDELDKWERFEDLLEMCHFIAATRPGFTMDTVLKRFGKLEALNIHFLNTPELDISSTDIRYRAKSNISIKYIVPTSVEQYILKHNLYK